MVRTRRIEGFSETGRPVSTPTTKFGGQPVWLTDPQWPISAAWDRPMRFVGQIELGPVLGAAGHGKMAYVFVTHADHEEEYDSLMRTLAAAGPVKMTLMDLLPPHDGEGEVLSRPVTEAADAFRAALDGALHRAQAAGAARPEVTGDDVSLLLRALAYATDVSEGEALDRAVGIVLDGLGVPR
ncbi:hypothetical protein [Streptomyces kanamyceticus]|uniref:SbtR family transcriptional regulator n=1 Tax=Streptomyces kanamyceticus TaxID=1967 RepID=UPI001CC81D30|nr:hypothetical protein [Streptomyces kanamyceticus]